MKERNSSRFLSKANRVPRNKEEYIYCLQGKSIFSESYPTGITNVILNDICQVTSRNFQYTQRLVFYLGKYEVAR